MIIRSFSICVVYCLLGIFLGIGKILVMKGNIVFLWSVYFGEEDG